MSVLVDLEMPLVDTTALYRLVAASTAPWAGPEIQAFARYKLREAIEKMRADACFLESFLEKKP